MQSVKRQEKKKVESLMHLHGDLEIAAGRSLSEEQVENMLTKAVRGNPSKSVQKVFADKGIEIQPDSHERFEQW